MFEWIERLAADGLTWPEAFVITVVSVLVIATVLIVARFLLSLV